LSTPNGSRPDRPERRLVADAVAARKRAQMVSGLRGLARPGAVRASSGTATAGNGAPGNGAAGTAADPNVEYCDICRTSIPADHRHLLHLVERSIECVCESCWALRSGDPEYRPTGSRILWLPDLDVPDDLWASFQIPIGLAFFMVSSVTGGVVALYPSPAGATESELHFEAWNRMCELNPIMAELETDVEGLVVNRLSDPPAYAIAPIDRCYELTGLIKAAWEGISGGNAVESAVAGFFEDLHEKAGTARRAPARAPLSDDEWEPGTAMPRAWGAGEGAPR
jgi:hypothetical protein